MHLMSIRTNPFARHSTLCKGLPILISFLYGLTLKESISGNINTLARCKSLFEQGWLLTTEIATIFSVTDFYFIYLPRNTVIQPLTLVLRS